MKQPLHLIFIPGLGDQNPTAQRRAVNTWHWWGVEAELFQMNWADKEPWEAKFERLLARIDELDRRGKAVALVGASAGASAVINAYEARTNVVVGCVLIAGKVNRPDAIGQRYRDENPAFITSAYDCIKAIETLNAHARQRILSRYALFDETVANKDSHISGANNRRVLMIGHVFTIATQITLGAPSFVHFLKRLNFYDIGTS